MTIDKLSVEAKAWRNAQRARLVALRLSYSEEVREDWTARIIAQPGIGGDGGRRADQRLLAVPWRA